MEKRKVLRNEVEECYSVNTNHATQLHIFKDHKLEISTALRVTNETRVGLGDTLLPRYPNIFSC